MGVAYIYTFLVVGPGPLNIVCLNTPSLLTSTYCIQS